MQAPAQPQPQLPPPSLRRSISFWAGLLIILCGCWAWWQSSRMEAGVAWGGYGVASKQRAIQIAHRPGLVGSGFRYGSGSLHPGSIDYQHEPFPRPFLVHASAWPSSDTHPGLMPRTAPDRYRQAMQYAASFNGPGSWMLYLPYWLLLLCFIPAWAGLLVWQRRRIRKIHRAGETSPI